MEKPAQFDDWRQRAALTSLSEPGFLSSAEGLAFIEQVHVYLTNALIGYTRKKLAFTLDRDEAVNIVLLLLLERDGIIASYAATAANPWGYIVTSAISKVRHEMGPRGDSIDDMLVEPRDPLDYVEETYTSIEEVVALTYDTLVPRTPAELHGELYELLGWLAVNPQQRLSYEKEDRKAAHRHCPSFTIDQVKAVMNIAWGGRPRRAETSLMGAFLLDPCFVPAKSVTHARALKYYKEAIRAGANGSRMLMDWI